MAEWLVEEGIGETRGLLVEAGEVLAARLHWPGELVAGQHYPAQLEVKRGGTRRGVARLCSGAQVLVDHLPPAITEGVRGTVAISRAAISERGRLKHAQARWVDRVPDASTAAVFPNARRVQRFDAGLWEEVWHAASSGALSFPGGEIVCSAAPAMTVIDVDGDGSPRDLALAAIPAIARALRWFDIGGSIAIDFPSLAARTDRRAVDAELGGALVDWPHERTAMNGFGLVQIVVRLHGPSLLHRFASSRVGLCARYALRAAERVEGPGVTQISVHPALSAKLKPEWRDDLQRRTGRGVRITSDPHLALTAPHAQIVEA